MKHPDVRADVKKGTHVHTQPQEAAANGQTGARAQTGLGVRGRRGGQECPQPALPLKAPPGTYRGKVVQSKVACIWKLSSTVERAAAMASMTKPGSHCGVLEKKAGPKSALDRAGHGPGSVAPGWPRLGPSRPSAPATLSSISSNTSKTSKRGHRVDKPPRVHSQNRITMETEGRRYVPSRCLLTSAT